MGTGTGVATGNGGGGVESGVGVAVAATSRVGVGDADRVGVGDAGLATGSGEVGEGSGVGTGVGIGTGVVVGASVGNAEGVGALVIGVLAKTSGVSVDAGLETCVAAGARDGVGLTVAVGCDAGGAVKEGDRGGGDWETGAGVSLEPQAVARIVNATANAESRALMVPRPLRRLARVLVRGDRRIGFSPGVRDASLQGLGEAQLVSVRVYDVEVSLAPLAVTGHVGLETSLL